MELRATREMRRNEQLTKTMAKKAGGEAPAQSRPAPAQTPTDKVSLSRQALAWVQEQNQKMWEPAQERREPEQQDGSSELDLLEQGLDVLEKCLKIAASIRKGDKVPPEDLEYLQNNDPAGYALAMAQRQEKKDPEEVKSVLDDEDRNGSGEESGGGDAPAVSAPEASSGGGEASAAAE